MITSMCSRPSFHTTGPSQLPITCNSLFMKLISQRGQRTMKVMTGVFQIGCIFIIIPGHYEIDFSSYNSVAHLPLHHWVNTDEKMLLIVCSSSFIFFSSYSSSPSPRPISCHLSGSFKAISFMRSVLFGSQHRPAYSSGFERSRTCIIISWHRYSSHLDTIIHGGIFIFEVWKLHVPIQFCMSLASCICRFLVQCCKYLVNFEHSFRTRSRFSNLLYPPKRHFSNTDFTSYNSDSVMQKVWSTWSDLCWLLSSGGIGLGGAIRID